MRIKKTIADEVANKMVSERRNLWLKSLDEFKQELFDLCVSKVPKEILTAFKKHPKYIETCSSVRLVGNGFNHEYFGLGKCFPSHSSSSETIVPTEEQGTKWIKIWNDYKNEEKAIKDLKRDIENALINLKTYKAVQDNFIEAFEHLPKQSTTSALSINLTDIKTRLNK